MWKYQKISQLALSKDKPAVQKEDSACRSGTFILWTNAHNRTPNPLTVKDKPGWNNYHNLRQKEQEEWWDLEKQICALCKIFS